MSEWPLFNPVYEIDGSGNVKQRYDGPPCPDASHDCRALGCGRVESWPLDGPQPNELRVELRSGGWVHVSGHGAYSVVEAPADLDPARRDGATS